MGEHEHVCQLIPWYVNGTLGEHEMDQVSRHVADCPKCALEVDKEVEIAKQMRSDPPELAMLMDRQGDTLHNLQSRLHTPPGQFLARHSAGVPRWAQWPALAATLLVAVAAGFFAGRTTDDTTYTLMTSPQTGNGPVVQVIFQPTANEYDLRQLLIDSGGKLLGNPSTKGVYRIELPPHVGASDYAKRLTQHPVVRWAEVEL